MKEKTVNLIKKNASLVVVVIFTYFVLFILSAIFKLVLLRAIAGPQVFFMLLSWIVVSIVLLVWAYMSKKEEMDNKDND